MLKECSTWKGATSLADGYSKKMVRTVEMVQTEPQHSTDAGPSGNSSASRPGPFSSCKQLWLMNLFLSVDFYKFCVVSLFIVIIFMLTVASKGSQKHS